MIRRRLFRLPMWGSGSASAVTLRLNSDGSADPTFTVGVGTNNSVYKVGTLASGKLLACGQFTTYAGVAAKRVVRINTNGTRDAAFNTSTNAGPNNYVMSFVEQPDAKIIIVGGFTSYNGVNRYRVARVTTTGANDASPGGEQLSFKVDIADDLMASIDEGDLSEILGNLVENAVRYAKSEVRVDASATSGGVVIAVADDGPGIPEADRQSALSRGVQLDSKGGSSGLGLAIVSDIVEAYGGRLDMANANPGLVVTISLPRHR